MPMILQTRSKVVDLSLSVVRFALRNSELKSLQSHRKSVNLCSVPGISPLLLTFCFLRDKQPLFKNTSAFRTGIGLLGLLQAALVCEFRRVDKMIRSKNTVSNSFGKC